MVGFIDAEDAIINTSWDEISVRQTGAKPDRTNGSGNGSVVIADEDDKSAPISTNWTVVIGDENDESAPLFVKAFFAPGAWRAPHTHDTDYAEIVLEGSQQVTGRWEYPGHVRIVKAGTWYGPATSGPEGTLVFTIYRTQDWPPVHKDTKWDPKLEEWIPLATKSSVEVH